MQKASQQRGEAECQGGGEDRGYGEPDDEGVRLPEPELANELERSGAGGGEEGLGGEWHGGGVEEARPEVDPREDQCDLERVDDVIADL